ncbi:Uncharacterized protein TCM_026591 [Theobroma cacao]|uniref:Uncharacterized protein n=1 Tax=Theobroma cacao TaxID=3641 RepID=A0A061FA74_THECC|nr:Uncharacterized protein TCM_026591 [Theobroma cacao]
MTMIFAQTEYYREYCSLVFYGLTIVYLMAWCSQPKPDQTFRWADDVTLKSNSFNDKETFAIALKLIQAYHVL